METRRQSKRKEAASLATIDSGKSKRQRQSDRTRTRAGSPVAGRSASNRAKTTSTGAHRGPRSSSAQGAATTDLEPGVDKGKAALDPAQSGSKLPHSQRGLRTRQSKGKEKAKVLAESGAMDKGVGGRNARSRLGQPESPAQHSGSDDDGDMADHTRDLSSASSALQGLLKKLGAGFDDILPIGFGLNSGRLKNILASLKSEESSIQLDGLSQLCELLSISTEEALTSFPVDEFVPILVQLLGEEHSPDMMLFAARALTFLADVLPSSCNAIVGYNAVPAFCARLLNIEYIDLAEQSLQALGKIAAEHPGACLQAGGMCAVLSFLDFFPTSMQHVAVVTAANMANGASPSCIDQVKDTVPILTNLLQHHDPKVVDNSCLALSRLADAISKHPQYLEDICTKNLIEQVMNLISLTSNGSMTTNLNISTYFGLIRLLATCASALPVVAEMLLQGGISSHLRRLISSSAFFASATLSSTSMLKSVDQLSLVLSLASALLPSVPEASAIAMADPPVDILDCSSVDIRSSSKTDGDTVRVVFLAANPGILRTLGMDLMDQLLQIYGGTVAPGVRQHCLSTITKLLHHSKPGILQEILKDLPISSFIGSLLGSRETSVVANALQLAEILLLKLPTTVAPFFLKEGVVHAIEQLAEQAPSPPPPRATRMRTRSQASRGQSGKEGEDHPASSSVQAAAEGVSAEPQPPKAVDLRLAVNSWAARFRKVYFVDAGISSENLDTDGIQAMRSACKALEAQDPGCVSAFLQLLESPEQKISSFEFLTSGAVEVLQCSLVGTELGMEDKAGALLQRLAKFAGEALPRGSGEAPPLLALVTKLHECLASTETFPVLLSTVQHPTSSHSSYSHHRHRSHHPNGHGSQGSGSGSSLSNGLAALCQPFKLRLCRESGDRSVRDYSSNVVLIEPLATMRAIEDFLWQRVQLPEGSNCDGPSRDARRNLRAGSSGAGRSSAAEGGAGPAASAGNHTQSKPVPIDDQNPTSTDRMTRSAARASANAAANAAAHSRPKAPPSEEEAALFSMGQGAADNTEDEEEIDDDEDLMLEDDDYGDEGLDDLGMSMGAMRVHDVSKSTAGGSSPSAEGRPGIGSAGRRSAAPGAAGPSDGGGAQGSGQGGSGRGGAGSSNEPRLVFHMSGQVLQPATTIFQAILQARQAEVNRAENAGEDPPACSQRLWDTVYSVTYARSGTSDSVATGEQSVPRAGDPQHRDGMPGKPNCNATPEGALLQLLELPALDGLQAGNTTMHILSVLRLMEVLNRQSNRLISYLESGCSATTAAPGYVPRSTFVSRKLSPKLAQQLQDVLSICGGSLPSWCHTLVRHAPFLFPFELRRRYFQCTALGLARALQHLQQAQAAENGAGANSGSAGTSSDGREMRLARLQRQKVRVNRPRILESAVKVMELYASHRAVLEVEYVGEVGTGLGPTLEFYTLLSHELQRKGLGMWHENSPVVQRKGPAADKEPATSSGEPMIVAPHGLFPVPILDTLATTRTIERFRLLGRMMAKALQDSRLLDLPLSQCFYRAALGRPLDLYDISSFDPQLGASLVKLSNAARKTAPGGKVQIDGVAVEDLCLHFTLPGQGESELKPGGRDIPVTSSNVEEYLAAVVDALLGEGIAPQMDAFRSGFNEVFSLDHLQCFYEDELEIMLCGSDDPWDMDFLLKNIKFDHGYSSESAPVRSFVEALCELDDKDRRSFLRFVTGSPRLPPGGLGALQPQLTVVRKHPSGGDGFTPGTTPGTPGMRLEGTTMADNDLVSVMTCANYIKLPPYSCKNVLVDRLMYAIREGQCSFDLS